MLMMVRLPSGAQRLSTVPSSLPGPGMGEPEVSSLVDQSQAWRVPEPLSMVREWLDGYSPGGLRRDGWSPPADALTGEMAAVSYRGPASKAWKSADLEIGTAADGTGASVIRVDAVIVWLDPVPKRSGPGAHPARVTLAGGCPVTDQGVTGVSNPGAGLTGSLLPSGVPVGGLRCRYDGANGHPWHLVSETRLAASAARQEAATMSALPLAHVVGGTVSCPMEDGSAEIVVLAYAGRPDIDLWVTLGGCGGVSNGYITAGGV
jgi:hypothetical protein